MKSFFSFIFLFLFANSVYAANLCDTSCNLTITFPTGGSIEATEALTFTFGTGGTLDLGATGTVNTAVQPVSTDFSSGGELALAVGESITFDAGGSLDLGAGGNLDYTSIAITTDGNIDIQSVGGTESILLNTFTMLGTGVLTVTGSDIEIEGDVSTGGDMLLISTGSINVTGSVTAISLSMTAVGPIVAITDVESISITTTGLGDTGSISLSAAGSIVLSGSLTELITSDTATLTINNGGILDPVVVNASSISASLNTSGGLNLSAITQLTPLTEIVIDGVLYQIEYKTINGEQVGTWVAPDGTTGTLEFKDGEVVFVPDAKEGSGVIGLLMMFNLLIVVSVLRRYQSRFFFIR